MSKTRNQRRRDKARLALIVSIIAWAICIVALLATAPRSEAKADEFIQEADDGSLPGDDIPTETKCYMTEEEVREDYENEKIEAALMERANVIEDCIVTHYDCCVKCCGKTDGITASGVKAIPGVTVGVDPSIIPLGSDVLVDYGDGEIHYMRADDVGGAIKGAHIDVCVKDHQTAISEGVKTATIYWVEA